jgi:DUF1680 family protein
VDHPSPVLPSTGKLRPLPLTDVDLGTGFWGDLQRLNSTTILRHCLNWVERLGWTTNFDEAAAGTIGGGHRGREFADSEIYKILEAIAWTSAVPGADDSWETTYRGLLARVAAAQEEDGYLHTLFGRPGQRERWSDLEWGHELYCAGHFLQAAVARARTSPDGTALVVARRLADHVCATFGPGRLERVCGHAEIELGLVELFRETGHRPYLDQAALFVARRGTGTMAVHEFGAAYWQDDVPVREAVVLRGHAVRALYLAAGAVDVAVETGDAELLAALERQWHQTVARRTYLTGGMGSHHMDEAFGEDHVLPPDRCYCETCAGVASVMFSWRLLLATGRPEYADLIERTLHNVVATSPSAQGTAFFYANTLHQRNPGGHAPVNEDGVCIRGASSVREPWFEVSCCPPNLARTLASLGGYLATTDDTGVQLHLYATATIETEVPGGRRIGLALDADLPGSGSVRVRVTRTDDQPWAITLRIPSWAAGATLDTGDGPRAVAVGTVRVERAFAVGDVLALELPCTPRFTAPAGPVDAVRGCLAVERGPEVLCLESPDLADGVAFADVRLLPTAGLVERDGRVLARVRTEPTPVMDWPYGPPGRNSPDGPEHEVELIPIHRWGERGPSAMRVWIPVATV